MGQPRQGVLLLADYSAEPVWECGLDNPRRHINIGVDSLPLRSSTKARLRCWTDRYESSWDEDDPDGQAWSPADYAAFDQEGVSLWHLMRRELEPAFKVFFFSEQLKQFFDHPDEFSEAWRQAGGKDDNEHTLSSLDGTDAA